MASGAPQSHQNEKAEENADLQQSSTSALNINNLDGGEISQQSQYSNVLMQKRSGAVDTSAKSYLGVKNANISFKGGSKNIPDSNCRYSVSTAIPPLQQGQREKTPLDKREQAGVFDIRDDL
jgi:hypothetical protein